MSHIEQEMAFTLEEENYETDISEKVEEDYYCGYLENNLRQCVAHSKYNRICRYFVSSSSYSSGETTITSNNYMSMHADNEDFLFCAPNLNTLQKAPCVPKSLKSINSGKSEKLPETRMKKSSEKKLSFNFIKEVNNLRKMKRRKKPKSFIQPHIRKGPIPDPYIMGGCGDSLKEMRDKLKKRSQNLEKLMAKHRKRRSIYSKSYRSSKSTSCSQKTPKVSKGSRKNCDLGRYKSSPKTRSSSTPEKLCSKTPKISISLRLANKFQKSDKEDQKPPLTSSILNFQRASNYLKICSSTDHTNKSNTISTSKEFKNCSEDSEKGIEDYKGNYKFIKEIGTNGTLKAS